MSFFGLDRKDVRAIQSSELNKRSIGNPSTSIKQDNDVEELMSLPNIYNFLGVKLYGRIDEDPLSRTTYTIPSTGTVVNIPDGFESRWGVKCENGDGIVSVQTLRCRVKFVFALTF